MRLWSGNVEDEPSLVRQRGWLIGSFAAPPFDSDGFEFKWIHHPQGDEKASSGTGVDEKTLVILVHGRATITFPDVNETVEFSKLGDFLIWEKSSAHVFKAHEDSLLIVFRWPPRESVDALPAQISCQKPSSGL